MTRPYYYFFTLFKKFPFNFSKLVLIIMSRVYCRFNSVVRFFVIKPIKNYQKKPLQKVTCPIKSRNNIVKEEVTSHWQDKQQKSWVIAPGPGGLVSPPGRIASFVCDQAVVKNSQRHLADQNAICILHQSDCTWLCCWLSQWTMWGTSVWYLI